MSPDMLKSPKYALVAQDDQVLGISPPTKPLLSKREIVIISISALLLLFSNGLWLVNIARDDRISVPLHAVEDGLDSQELNVSDSHWEALFPPGAGVVALPPSYVKEKNLPASINDPESGKLLYVMSGYHTLHCLTHVRHIMLSYWMHQNSTTPHKFSENTWLHGVHCMAAIRQDILCHLDENLLGQENIHQQPGEGQMRKCKDLRPINDWLEKHKVGS